MSDILPELPLPELPAGLPSEPGALLQSMIPDRIIPMLMQRFAAYAAKIEVRIGEYHKADGTVLPAETLIAKFISNSVDSKTGEFHEFYALIARDGDPECFMDFLEYPVDSPAEGVIDCEVTRCCATSVEVYFDGVLKASFPEVSGPGPHVGYTPFNVYTP